jgi:predicted alpha/beta hydrolase
LAGDFFAAQDPRAVVLIAGAMGVHRRYYAGFAQHLARRGLSVLTFDYRGTAGSAPKRLRGFEASLHGWAELDLPAAIDACSAKAPGLPLLYVAHSVGGQLLGLIPEWQRIHAALTVASQSGFWKLWPGKGRAGMWLLWHVGIPVTTALFGYLPMKLFGQGENIPLGVAREWARWGRHPRYVLSYAEERGDAAFATFDRPLRAYLIADDTYAPAPTVRRLFDEYTAAKKELKVVAPGDVGAKAIGHFGFFRAKFEATLWNDAAEWLLAQAGVRRAA